MKKIVFVFALVLAATMVIPGCTKIKRTYKWTMEHVDPDPQVDLQTEDLSDDPEERLAMLFAPVDERMQELSRALATQEDYPDEAWFEIIFRRFPWISGIFTVQASGDILVRRPEAQFKQLTVEPLIEIGEEWNDRKLRAHVEPSDFGPEIYLANPFIREMKWMGLTVVHFDYRSLVKYSPDPDSLVVVTREMVLWEGSDADLARQLKDRDWETILADDVAGEFETEDGRTVTWLARYIGGKHLIYGLDNSLVE